MRCLASPTCYLCGASGNVLYSDLTDRLFHVPGKWNLRVCPTNTCGLVWLDPLPLEADIHLAYEQYYTHDASAEPGDAGAKRILRSLYRTVLGWTPIGRERRRVRLAYLDEVSPGRLLEVGCGNGQRLATLRTLGWQVEGQEVDVRAAEHAGNHYGLTVHVGELTKLRLPEAGFDAVIMNHVIEHVHDPIALLTECRRVLKTGGRLVAVTPNIESYGHEHFGVAWRGLDVPRHLHVFSRRTLTSLARRAGFDECETWTTAAQLVGIGLAGADIQRYGQHVMGAAPRMTGILKALAFQLRGWYRHNAHPDSGDECVLQAYK